MNKPTRNTLATPYVPNLVFDIGMHRGEDTEFYLKKGFNVVAFEAVPEFVAECKEKFLDFIQQGRLTIIEGAIVEPEKIAQGVTDVTFYRNDYTVWGTLYDTWAKRNEVQGTKNKKISVPAVNFHNVIEKLGIPYFMKIDIEGADLICLKALEHFANKPKYISIESDKLKFSALVNEMDIFESLGYTDFKVVQQFNIVEQVEPSPAREGNTTQHVFTKGCSGLFGEDIPQPWKSRTQVIKQYRFIFFLYWLFGDYGIISRYNWGKWVRRKLSRLFKCPVPGWYDTHARRPD